MMYIRFDTLTVILEGNLVHGGLGENIFGS